jgi:hypothetical protein
VVGVGGGQGVQVGEQGGGLEAVAVGGGQGGEVEAGGQHGVSHLSGGVQDQQILAGGDGAGFAAEELQHLAVFGGGHGEFHLHGLDDHQRVAGLHVLAGLDQHLPDVAGHVAGHQAGAFGQVQLGVGRRRGDVGLADVFGLAGGLPAFPLGFEGGLLAGLEAAMGAASSARKRR